MALLLILEDLNMSDISESQKKAFDFAQELTKQVITLASGIITITITFMTDFVGQTFPAGAKTLLAVSWIFYILAVVFGVITLMGLTGSLADGEDSIKGTNMRRPAAIQHTSFILGLILTVASAVWAL